MARKKGKKAKQAPIVMIKIKALTSFSGPHGSFARDNEYDVPQELGQSWIDCGFAEKAGDDLFEEEES